MRTTLSPTLPRPRRSFLQRGLRARQVYFEREPQMVAKMPDHELWMAFFNDPDGNLLALMEEKR